MRLLLINPNTSAHITERMAASARAALGPGDGLTALTAPDGPAAVRSAAELVVADASALQMARLHAAGHDALLLAISLDGAADALRAQHPGLPVAGMTEAALAEAAARVDRIGLLTLGPAMLPLYRARVEQLGLAGRVVAWEAPDAPAAFAAPASGAGPGAHGGADADPQQQALLQLLQAAVARLQQQGAQAVVLAGAVLCGHAPALQAGCGLPVIDGVTAAAHRLRGKISLLRGGASG